MRIQTATLAIVLGLFTHYASALDCTVTVDSTDQMQFDTKAITISKSCEEFSVSLTHSGKLPASAMGHNWVLSKSDDMQSVASEGIAAGLANQYVKPGDERVIAFTDIIGGGQSTSVTFPVSALSADESYTFFCSFPGHVALMNGVVTLVD